MWAVFDQQVERPAQASLPFGFTISLNHDASLAVKWQIFISKRRELAAAHLEQLNTIRD